MKYLLDTNVISELVARQPEPMVLQWLDTLDAEQVYLSVITLGELKKGIEKLPDSARKETLNRWLHDELLDRFSGRILVLNIEVMLAWGKLTSRLESIGRPLSAFDSLIAALALYHNCILVTRNEADFRDTNVSLINPWL
ncbi:MAG: type II toxin-antitoxin system VapC family toxin [Anaerolineae bacterium]|nr:type II toxin-antitoxin system VapC family toxin [Anaerolineae bacterium]